VQQFRRALQQRTPGERGAALALLASVALSACASSPKPAPIEPASTLAEFSERRLEKLQPGLPPPAGGWDRSQWLAAALQLNPQLAEQRAQVAAIAAGERTAREYPNPNVDLFAAYLGSIAHSSAWLYGVSMDFLLHRPGERARARERASVQTALAEEQLAESIWQVRTALRQALLDAAATHDTTALLDSLVAERQTLLDSDRARTELGEFARAQWLPDELELSRALERRRESQAHSADAVARLAATVGVPLAALDAIPVRWDDWAEIDKLTTADAERYRTEALIGRPQIAAALREYDLAEINLQNEVGKRWPQLTLTPGYQWGAQGASETAQGNIIPYESSLQVSFELPLFNQHQGPIGEALARRTAAGEHLKAVQAQAYGQIDRAEVAWPMARQAWQERQKVAAIANRQHEAEQAALAVGATDRPSVVSAQIAATEAKLAVLEAAYEAELAFGALEDAYRRPLQGPESQWPPRS